MSENINIDNQEENYLFGKGRENNFSMPKGYFDSLEQRIINKLEAQEELSEFNVLSTINKKEEFIIPADYFTQAENEIEYKTELAQFSKLNTIVKPAENNLTEDYLTSLSEKIKSKVELNEELKSYSTLYYLEKQNNFEIQADYFDTVADRIKQRIHSSEENRIAVLEKVFLFFLKPKFGLAFGIAVITGLSIVFYINNKNTTITDGDCKTLACLEKREMLNEHTIREMDEDNLYDMVDVDKLDKQISGAETIDSAGVNKQKSK